MTAAGKPPVGPAIAGAPLGGEVSVEMATFVRAIGRHDPRSTALYAADAVGSFADSDDGLPPRASITSGPIDTTVAVSGLEVGAVRAIASVDDGPFRFLEAQTTRPGAAPRSLAVLLTVDGSHIARAVVFTAAAVDPPAVGGVPAAAPAADVIDRYLAYLEAGELDAAAACFTSDCLYSHPPYAAGEPRADFRGRGELLDGFKHRRGRRSSQYEVLRIAQAGQVGFVEGLATTTHAPEGTTFLSSFSIGAGDLIGRYVAYYSSPAAQVRTGGSTDPPKLRTRRTGS